MMSKYKTLKVKQYDTNQFLDSQLKKINYFKDLKLK